LQSLAQERLHGVDKLSCCLILELVLLRDYCSLHLELGGSGPQGNESLRIGLLGLTGKALIELKKPELMGLDLS